MKLSLAVALMLSLPLMNTAAAQTESKPAEPSAAAQEPDLPEVPPPTPAATASQTKPDTAAEKSDQRHEDASEAHSPRSALGVRLAKGPVVDVVGVIKGSPADRAGIIVGDLIISMNGTQYTSPTDFLDAISKVGVNQTVKLEIDRHGEPVYPQPKLESWDSVFGTSGTSVTALRPVVDSGESQAATSSQPSAEQPMPNQPSVTQPSASQPMTSQPSASQPMSSQPMTSQPSAGQPMSGQPMTGHPSAFVYGCGCGYPAYWTGYRGYGYPGYGGYGYPGDRPWMAYVYTPCLNSGFYAPYSASLYYGYGPAYSCCPRMSWGCGWPIW